MASYRINALVLSLIIIIEVILVSGCTDQDAAPGNNGLNKNILSNITSAFKELPDVQYFLTFYPNASITTSYLNGNKMETSLKDTDLGLEGAKSQKALYRVSMHDENSSIVSWFDDGSKHVSMKVQNPPMMEDISERLQSYDNLTFNIVKIDSDIYVTFTGGQDADKVDFLGVNGYTALGHHFEFQILGKEDGKYDDIVYRTVKLEGACSSCWKNFVMIFATFTNGDRQTVLKAHI